MYKANELLESPPADAVLWRYMSFTKFVSLLTKEALFFVRVDKLGDPFEGSLSPVNVKLRPELYKGKPEVQQLLIGPFIKTLRRLTLVNCWHENEFESDAMWKLYSGIENRIAIRTDFHSLANSLMGEQEVHIGRVKYVDYEETFIEEIQTLIPFTRKRKSFVHEREVRALIVEATTGLVADIMNQPAHHEVGTYHQIDTSILIKEVVVPPLAGDWFIELVETTARSFKLSAPVRKSSLAARPIWT